jgi:poly(hydroxyalkanoate) granule-associated protein
MATSNGKKKQSKPEAPAYDPAALPKDLTERSREIWLAGLGAFSQASEEGNKAFRTLVERGRGFETRRREEIESAAQTLADQQKKVTDQVTQTISSTAKTVEKAMSDTLTATLNQVGIPTRSEVQSLSSKVGRLSDKLDALAAMLDTEGGSAGASASASQAAVVYHVIPRESGWAVQRDGAQQASSVHDTKKEAVTAARELAKSKAPSELVIFKQDRTVQETFAYGEEDTA